jgi:hypothetical protein
MIANADVHECYLASLQRLRARTYLDDGAIQPLQIDDAGRFQMHQDEECWHFLLLDCQDQVVGCVRYLAHPNTACFEDLWISHSPQACDPEWAAKLRSAIESDLLWARRQGLSFVEVGGWAIASEYRHTRAALEVMLASFAWGRLIGGAIGCCTATARNNSASILRRIGGMSLEHDGEAIPPYADVSYGCSMEILRFQFQAFDPRYQKIVNDIYRQLTECSTVIQRPGIPRNEVADIFLTDENLRALQRVFQHTEQNAMSLA